MDWVLVGCNNNVFSYHVTYLYRGESESIGSTAGIFTLRMSRISELHCRINRLLRMKWAAFKVWSLNCQLLLIVWNIFDCMKYFITWKCVWQWSQKSVWQAAHNFQNTFLQVLTFVFVSKMKVLRLNLVSLRSKLWFIEHRNVKQTIHA